MTVARDKGLRSLLEKRLPLTITTSRGDKQPPVGTSELVLWEDTSQRAMKILLRSGGKIYVFTTEISIDDGGGTTAYWIDVKELGAKGDGVTNDTNIIQLALDSAYALGGATVYFPAGTYRVRSSAADTDQPILEIKGPGVNLLGVGGSNSIIKVANNSLFYRYLIRNSTSNPDCSGFSMQGLTIDQNIGNNGFTASEVVGNIRKNHAFALGLTHSSDIRIENCVFKNFSSTNCLYLNSRAGELGQTTIGGSRVRVRNCTFIYNGTNPNGIVHDSSIIYTAFLDQVLIEGNIFESNGVASESAICAIETHTSDTIIRNNIIDKYIVGMNVTGISSVGVTDQILVEGNTIRDTNYGIRLFSDEGSTPHGTLGLHNVVVNGNSIYLAETNDWPASTNAPAGIRLPLQPQLPIRNIIINGNTVRSPLETTSKTPVDYFHGGIGGWDQSHITTQRNIQITNNIIENFPGAGIAFRYDCEGVNISGNLLYNCASSLDTVWRADGGAVGLLSGIYIYSRFLLRGLTLKDNTILDTNATTRMIYGILMGYDSVDGTQPEVYDLGPNLIRATGATQTTYAGAFGVSPSTWKIHWRDNTSYPQWISRGDPIATPGDLSNYAVLVRRPASDLNMGAGIAFNASSVAADVGAALVFERTGSNSKGRLKLYVKDSATSLAAPSLVATFDGAAANFDDDVEVDGTLGRITLADGNAIEFSRAGSNYIVATASGGDIRFQVQGVATDRLIIGGSGIQVEGITMTDTINENTTDAGVTIESILLENGFIELTEVSSPSTPTSNKARLFLSTTTGELRLLKDSGDEVTVENTGWDDVRVNANAVKTQGASNLPGFEEFPASSGLYTWVFDGTATMQQVYFSVQLPHRYKAGSDIKPHVHYCPTDNSAGTVKWFLDYVWQNVGGTFASSATTISGTDEVSANSIRDHLVCGLGTITGTGMKESSMLLCRLYRTPSDGDDDYAADVAFLEFDIHYECEKMGTTNEYPS